MPPYMFVFPLLSLSLAQRRVWLGEATKSGAAMAAPAAPAPTALNFVEINCHHAWHGKCTTDIKEPHFCSKFNYFLCKS